MKSRILIITIVLALMFTSAVVVLAQDDEGQFEQVHIFTTATDAVGVGTYVAAEAYGVPAGSDPAEDPALAMILPYAIYPNMLLDNIEDFVQPEPLDPTLTTEWSLVAADGSEATLLQDGPVAIFMADVEGEYHLTLTVTDENGNVGESTWIVYATYYQGVGGLDGYEPYDTNCSYCHEEQTAAWLETGHATMFTRALDGEVSDHYGPNCISCHTTGFNNRPEAENDGFDDLAAASGWVFPEELGEGGWEAFVEEYPEVAALANIQCESCHGPGGLHVWAEEDGPSMIGTGMAYGTCAQCHAEEPYHVFPQQWELSGHAQKNARAFTYPVGEGRESCARCHSGEGFMDFANGEEVLSTDYQIITCAVCHDPHDASNPGQLRIFDSVVLPSGLEVADEGPAATCMSCHNVRLDPVASVARAIEDGSLRTPHYSNAAELMNTIGGFTWGENMPTSTHGNVIDNTCISCHMAATPGMDADDNPLAGHNTVGQHTFAMTSPVDGTENVAVCQECHDGATNFEFEARRDYDGDGAIESNQVEIEGLKELVLEKVVEAGVVVLDRHPYYEWPDSGVSEDVYGAVWNVQFIHDGSSAVHNLRYAVSLLQLSYEKLAMEAVPGAYIIPLK